MRPNNLTNHFFFLILTSLIFSGCSVNQAEMDNNLQKYFDARGVDGSFTMLNNSNGKITVYNMALDTSRYLPASTFKIVNSLIGLETGAITDENMTIPWDGVKRSNPEWNKTMDMKEAFKVSNVAYYQEVARRIGKDTMQQWLDTLSYGNKQIGEYVDSFWLNNTLKISPDEQLGLLKKLYFDQLPFRKSVQQTLRNVMLQEDNTAYKLSYKTGWGFDNENHAIGWLVGWIEENSHVYFFVTFIKSDNKDFDMKPARIGITKDILKEYGFFEGKK